MSVIGQNKGVGTQLINSDDFKHRMMTKYANQKLFRDTKLTTDELEDIFIQHKLRRQRMMQQWRFASESIDEQNYSHNKENELIRSD